MDTRFRWHIYILLDGEPRLEMRVLVKHAQLWGESLYFDGKIDYYEATNSETLTNAFVALSAKGVHPLYHMPLLTIRFNLDHLLLYVPSFAIELIMRLVFIGLFLGFNKVTLNLYFGRW